MKFFFICLICFNLFIFNTKAQIVYLDINLILNKSEVGKFLNDHIQKIKNENMEKFKKIENELIQKEKSLIAQKNILNKDEFQKKLNSLSIEVKKYRSEKKSSIDKINEIKISNTKEILKVLNPIVTKYVDSNAISLVIPKKNIIVGKKNLDITDQIIEILNNNIKKLSF